MLPLPHTSRRTALAAILAPLVPAVARARTAPPAIPALVDAAFRPLLAQHDIAGMAVAVSVDGQRHVSCYGVASKQDARPVTPATLFEIGSLSKTFTATLGGYALARGKLSLHDRPGRFVPQLRGAPIDRATLLELATFTAGGLPLQFPDALRDDGMLEFFRQWRPIAAPGRVRQYSNPSIGLFGFAAARALGREFIDAVQDELFPRLGLAHSYLRVPDTARPEYAWGYGKDGQAMHVHPGVLDAEAYGVKSTASDMIRFVEANLRPELLAAPLRQAIEATQVGYFRIGGMVQGLGWEQYPFPVPLDRLLAGNAPGMALQPHEAIRLAHPGRSAAPTLYNKTGSTNGFASYAAFVPARRIGLVMLANRNFAIEARVRAAHAVLDALTRG